MTGKLLIFVKDIALTPSEDESGHFTCSGPGPEYSYHLISVKDY